MGDARDKAKLEDVAAPGLDHASARLDPADLSRQAVGGTLWTYLSFAVSRLITFASTILLARLLVPEQFGLMGYCLLAVQYLEILNTFGLDAALIARRDRFEQAANATFFVCILTGVALYGVAWIAAPGLATFFRAPEVTPLFRVLCLVLPIGSLDLVPNALVHRTLRFKYNLIPDVSAHVVRGTLSVVLAWKGFGVWSLVYGYVAGESVTTLAYWAIARWRPRMHFDAAVTREVLGYGIHLVGVGVAGAILANVDFILVGRLLGTTALGFYTLAYRTPHFVIQSFLVVVGRVGVPILARVQTEPAQLRAAFLRYTRYSAIFVFPAAAGMALTAEPLVHAFYTARWAPTVVPLQFVAVALAVSSTGFLAGILYKATNRPQILSKLALYKVPFAVVALWIGTRWDIAGVAAAHIVVALYNVTLDAYMVRRIVRVPLADLWGAATPALIATAIMTIVVGTFKALAEPGGLAGLILAFVVGILSYTGALTLVSRETVTKAIRVLGVPRASSRGRGQ